MTLQAKSGFEMCFAIGSRHLGSQHLGSQHFGSQHFGYQHRGCWGQNTSRIQHYERFNPHLLCRRRRMVGTYDTNALSL